MKSSMTVIQSNGWTEIDLILKQKWRRFIWWQVSFKWHSYPWPVKVTSQPTFNQFSWPWRLGLHRITSDFHGAFATGVASQQGTLTLPDTWLRPPLGTCLCNNCWDHFTELVSFLDFSPWIPLGTFLILLVSHCVKSIVSCRVFLCFLFCFVYLNFYFFWLFVIYCLASHEVTF